MPPDNSSSRFKDSQNPENTSNSDELQSEEEKSPLDRIGSILESLPESGVTLFTNPSAPNGLKVAILLCELNVPVRLVCVTLSRSELHSPYYVAMNPVARIPTIIDHDNEDFVLWESGAILQYLCDRNSKKAEKLGLWAGSIRQRAIISQWLFMQSSSLAVMIGQAFHFLARDPVVAKYVAEVRRLYGVIEVKLAEQREDISDQDTEVWLAAPHITVADLSFLPWNNSVHRLGIELDTEFPEVARWTEAMARRPNVIRALAQHSAC